MSVKLQSGASTMERSTLPFEQVMTEAAEWFAAMRDSIQDPATHAEFVEWLLRSPDHIGAFLAITRTWGDVGGAVKDSGSAINLSIEALVNAARMQSRDSNVRKLSSFSHMGHMRPTNPANKR
jgi:ferric-dicitrate binding protein FerR (iron transport regulator)